MIQFNPSISPSGPQMNPWGGQVRNPTKPESSFSDTAKQVGDLVSKVDHMQQASDVSIADLLSGKNADITSVVSNVAKADMSFKLLVGVRNKLIEAYKQTMNMPL